jgi:type IV pilus assembly protein PilN
MRAVDLQINLLPWRQKRREYQQRQFLNMLALVALVGGLLLVVWWQLHSSQITQQEQRNALLEREIAVFEGRINEIRALTKKRKELLDRMRVIQELQGNRPVSVRLFDEMVRQLSDNVYFEKMSLRQERIDITGVAESNNRISTQLRNFTASEWFDGANVSKIDAYPAAGPEAGRFNLTVNLTLPDAEDE